MTNDTQFDLLAGARGPAPWNSFGPEFVHPPLARTSDPETSHAAARAYLGDAEAQNAQIIAFLRGVGTRGATHYEIATGLGWESVQVARRIAGLRQAGLLYSFDGKHGWPKLTRHGDGHRPCAIHVATGFGLPLGHPPEYAAVEKAA